MDIQAYDHKACQAFSKKHPARANNGHCDKRYVWMEILTYEGGDIFTRYLDVCPCECLDQAKALQDAGHRVSGIYAYYTPFGGYNNYEEASPWLAPNNPKGLSDGVKSLRNNCGCKRSR